MLIFKKLPQTKQTNKDKEPINPNKERTLYLINVILLCIITLGAMGASGFFFLRMRSARAELADLQHQINASDDAEKSLYTQEEVDNAIESARYDGMSSGRRSLKTQIQSQIESGKSTLSMLRNLFDSDIVVSMDGHYYFYPRITGMDASPFSASEFRLDENGRLLYTGSSATAQLSYGVDVSADNGRINWEEVAGDGMTFAMIRQGSRDSEGELVSDDRFLLNVEGAYDAGLKVGAYHNLGAVTVDEAVEEADALVQALEPVKDKVKGSVAVVTKVPAAGSRQEGLSQAEWTEMVTTFCDQIRSAGYQPMIYGSLAAMIMQLDQKQVSYVRKWINSPAEDLYYPYRFQMWKYSSEGEVAGIEGKVGLDAIMGFQ